MTATNKCARPASPTYLWPSWGIRQATPKEPPNEHAIEHGARILRAAGNRAGGIVGNPAVLLVRAARIMGEPIDLSCSDGSGCCFSLRVPDQPDWLAAPNARRAGARSGKAARSPGHALRLRCGNHHGDRIYRFHLLLARSAAQRAPRSQHSVLEVAA